MEEFVIDLDVDAEDLDNATSPRPPPPKKKKVPPPCPRMSCYRPKVKLNKENPGPSQSHTAQKKVELSPKAAAQSTSRSTAVVPSSSVNSTSTSALRTPKAKKVQEIRVVVKEQSLPSELVSEKRNRAKPAHRYSPPVEPSKRKTIESNISADVVFKTPTVPVPKPKFRRSISVVHQRPSTTSCLEILQRIEQNATCKEQDFEIELPTSGKLEESSEAVTASPAARTPRPERETLKLSPERPKLEEQIAKESLPDIEKPKPKRVVSSTTPNSVKRRAKSSTNWNASILLPSKTLKKSADALKESKVATRTESRRGSSSILSLKKTGETKKSEVRALSGADSTMAEKLNSKESEEFAEQNISAPDSDFDGNNSPVLSAARKTRTKKLKEVPVTQLSEEQVKLKVEKEEDSSHITESRPRRASALKVHEIVQHLTKSRKHSHLKKGDGAVTEEESSSPTTSSQQANKMPYNSQSMASPVVVSAKLIPKSATKKISKGETPAEVKEDSKDEQRNVTLVATKFPSDLKDERGDQAVPTSAELASVNGPQVYSQPSTSPTVFNEDSTELGSSKDDKEEVATPDVQETADAGKIEQKAPQKATAKPTNTAPTEPVRSSGRVSRPSRQMEDFLLDKPQKRKSIKIKIAPVTARGLSPKNVTTPIRRGVIKLKPLKIRRPLRPSVSEENTESEQVPSLAEVEVEKNPNPKEEVPKEKPSVVEKKSVEKEVVPAEAIIPKAKPKTGKQKLAELRKKAFLPGYVPSIKPIIECCLRPDGTTEKLGRTVTLVMDHVLAVVCDDGIDSHSKLANSLPEFKLLKKNAMVESNKLKYMQTKEEWQKLKDANDAAGLPTPIFSHYLMGPNKRKESVRLGIRSPISTPDQTDQDESRSRRNKGNIYKQNLKSILPQTHMPKLQRESKSPAESRHKTLTREPSFPQTTDSNNAYEAVKENYEDLRSTPSSRRPSTTHIPILKEPKKRRETVEVTRISFEDFINAKFSKNRDLVSSTGPTEDFFYRDVLRSSDSSSPTGLGVVDEEDDVEIDILDIPSTSRSPGAGDENSFKIPSAADEVAASIDCRLMRPSAVMEVEYGLDDLLLRAYEQTESRQNLLQSALRYMNDLYISRCSYQDKPIVVHNTALRLASELREMLHMFTEERFGNVVWLHNFLVEQLPLHLLSCYLILLCYIRQSFPNTNILSVVNEKSSTEFGAISDVSAIICDFVNTKIVDPEQEKVSRTIEDRVLHDVIFCLIPPLIAIGTCKTRYHSDVFKWLRQMGHPESHTLRLSTDFDDDASIAEACDGWVMQIEKHLRQLVRNQRDKRIVLVGWGFTCPIIHRVVQLVHGVSALIDLSFPLVVNGRFRGRPDDDILLTYCPSLFVCGSLASNYNHVAMIDMRKMMISHTGQVVIADADENLCVSPYLLSQHNITQKTVNRVIVEHIRDFLSSSECSRERSSLIPVDVNRIFQVDPLLLGIAKSTKKSEEAPQAPEKVEKRGRKRKTDSQLSSPVISTPPILPSTPGPSGDMSSAQAARSRFDQIVQRTVQPLSKPQPPHRLLMQAPSHPQPQSVNPDHISLN